MLKLENVTKIYENGTVALKDVSLELPQVGFVAVVGASGSGKSTLLNILTCNDEVTSGKVFFKGDNYQNLTRSRITSEFAYVYQDYKLIENLSVEDNIRIGYELSDSDCDFDIEELLEKVKIGGYGKESVTNLSGGQKQRVAIARALIRDPKVLVADEPTGNLDKINSNNIFELLKEVSKERLVIVVTHDTDLAEKYCNRIIKLDYGEVEYDNTLSETKEIDNTNERKVKKGGISSMSTVALAKSVNKGKRAIKIINLTLSIIMTMVLVLIMGLTMLTEEDAIYYNMKKNGGNAFAVYCTKRDGESSSYMLSLGDLKKKLDSNGIKSAAIYKSTDNLNTLLIDSNANNGEYIMHNKPVTIADEILFSLTRNWSNVIATDDIESIGIKLIDGRAPKGNDEVIISKIRADFMLKAKNYTWYKETDSGEYDTEDIIYNSYSDIYNKPTIYGNMKVVGIFEDYFDLSRTKFDKIAAKPKEYYQGKDVDTSNIKFYNEDKLSRFTNEKYSVFDIFLLKSIIVSEDAVKDKQIQEGTTKLFINGRQLSQRKIGEIHDWCCELYDLDDYGTSGTIFFEHDYCFGITNNLNGIIFYGEYLFVPILIFVIFVIALLALNHYIVTVKYNASDILILKSLGAKKLDILKVFAINAGVLLLFDLVIGIVFGIGLTALFDGLLRMFDGNAAYTLLPISFLPILTSATVVICIHLLALGANIFLFNDKNLRKAFQRAR